MESASENRTGSPAASSETAQADPAPDSPTATSTADAVSEATADATSVAETPELDLREANVVGVDVTRQNGSYRFAVTLYHDDDGESGYADWWQVETLDGEQLGRRTLLHAHSTAPFTRSETISIPEGISHVVVRGHDQTHGYGGQAMVVTLENGETEAVRQGPEPRTFA